MPESNSQPLTALALGARAKVVAIHVPPADKARLMEMGLLVGTQVEAGLGKRRPGAMLSILRSGDRSSAGALAVVGVFIRPGERNAALAPLFDAMPREVMKALRFAGIRTENLTEQALVDFLLSRAPPPERNLTRRERETKRMREKL